MEDLSKNRILTRGGYQAIVCGVSAGGLEALKTLLEMIPEDFVPALVIVQHLHPRQNDFLTEHLGRSCRLPLKEADEKESIVSGRVYMAPANYHLLIEADKTFSLCTGEKVNFSRPSIDVLFETAANVYGAGLIGIILTGANNDGAAGLRCISENAGLTIVQDPQTAEYSVMPQAALDATPVDYVLSLKEIGRKLCELGSLRMTTDRKPRGGNHGQNLDRR